MVLLLGFMILSGLACGKSGEELYNDDREKIGDAVSEYMTCAPGFCEWPPPVQDAEDCLIGGEDVKGSAIFEGEVYYPIAICPLLSSASPKGLLRKVPASCEAKNCADTPQTSANFNYSRNACDVPHNWGNNTADKLAVTCTGHYLWLTTETGDIASICIGDECLANDEDGYQGVYP